MRRKIKKRRAAPKSRRIQAYTYRRKIGRKFKVVKVRAYRRKLPKKLRPIRELVGWETIDRWRSELEHDFRGLDIVDPIPNKLQWAYPTEESYYLSPERRYPPKAGLYVVLAIFFVIRNTKTKEKFLWIRAKQLGTGWLSPEDVNVSAAREFYDEKSAEIQEKTDYLEVRHFAGWTVAQYQEHAETGAWFRGSRGKKRRHRKATT